MNQIVRLELRIPIELKRKLKVEAALRDFVSVNQFIISIAKAYIKNPELFEIEKEQQE